ncbi:MAG TPA: hypothetical protein VFG20_12605, partial [Planctomycetaceae bacterium]|nr:hypothetical protein [Planctomycetaceae bacterium]
RALPSTEPLMPLAKGVPVIDTAWLSQLIGYGTVTTLGLAGLQGLSAIAITLCSAVLLHRTLNRTRSLSFAMTAVVAFLWLDWAQLAVVRPQLAGLICFLALLHRTTSRQPRALDWYLIPTLFIAWANLHGSFIFGVCWLLMMTAGRAIDLLRRTGSVRSLTHDADVRRLLLWSELAAVAALINPYGIALYGEALRFGSYGNLASLTEWQVLDVRGLHGKVFLATTVMLVCLYRFTPRRVASWEALSLVGLSLATLTSARFIVWWSPVAALLLATHARAAVHRWWPWTPTVPPSPRTGKWSLVTAGLAWIFFAYSPMGMRLMHHREPSPERALSSFTPIAAVSYLKEHPPRGQVFNTYEWGDYLQWAGPEGVQVFVNSHAHVVPRDVWLHYMQVVEEADGWADILDRYGVNTILLDHLNRSSLIKKLKDDAKWKIGYDDKQAIVFLRRKPI